MDKQSLLNIFQQKESRKDTTNNAYATRLSGLAKRFGKYKEETYDSWEFLNNVDDVIHFICKVPNNRKDKNGENCIPNPATQIGNINPIIEYLLLINEHILADEYLKIKKIIDDTIDNIYKKNNGLTQLQEENIISYEDLLNYCELIDKEILSYDTKPILSHIDNWNIEDLKSIQILMRLYLLHPSRNEYASLKFITLRDYKKLKAPELNYIVLGTKKSFISITNYKMSEKYGVKLQEIVDKKLLKMLRVWRTKRTQQGTDNLFVLAKTGAQWENQNLCLVLTKFSKKLINKNIGSTLIYKIVISEAGYSYDQAVKNDDFTSAIKFNEVLEKFAKSRGHSQKVQKEFYKQTVSE